MAQDLSLTVLLLCFCGCLFFNLFWLLAGLWSFPDNLPAVSSELFWLSYLPSRVGMGLLSTFSFGRLRDHVTDNLCAAILVPST